MTDEKEYWKCINIYNHASVYAICYYGDELHYKIYMKLVRLFLVCMAWIN